MTVSPLSGAQQILAALSCVGGIFVIYCVARWPQLRSFAYRLVAMLVLAQVLGAAVHLLPEAQSGDLLCFIQAYDMTRNTCMIYDIDNDDCNGVI